MNKTVKMSVFSIIAALSLSLQAESLSSIKGGISSGSAEKIGMAKGVSEVRRQEVVLAGKKRMVNTSGKVERVDPEKRYAKVMANSKYYRPIPETVTAEVPRPMLGMNEWGFGVIGHWVKLHDNTPLSCKSEDMQLYMWWATNEGGAPTGTEPIIYISGKGWFAHEKVIKNGGLESKTIREHIKSCVESINNNTAPTIITKSSPRS